MMAETREMARASVGRLRRSKGGIEVECMIDGGGFEMLRGAAGLAPAFVLLCCD